MILVGSSAKSAIEVLWPCRLVDCIETPNTELANASAAQRMAPFWESLIPGSTHDWQRQIIERKTAVWSMSIYVEKTCSMESNCVGPGLW